MSGSTPAYITIDDRSSQIQYFGNWTNVGDLPDPWNNTLSATDTPGSYFSFNYTGSEIAIFGTISEGAPVLSTYTIDGNTTQFVGFSNGTQDQNKVAFYGKHYISEGTHTIVVNATNATSNGVFFFDFLAYVPSPSAAPSGTYLTTSLPNPSATSPVVIEVSPSSKTNVGAIVGGVVGGVVGLVIVAVAVFFLCFRQRRGGKAYFYQSAEVSDMLHHELKPDAYTVSAPSLPPESTVGSNAIPGPGSVARSTTNFSSPPPARLSDQPTSPVPAHTPDARRSRAPGRCQPNQLRSKAAEAGLLSVAQAATYHADSGVRFNPGGEASGSGSESGRSAEEAIPTDVPPMYSE
ncbi:hypothetical protein B0H21DRAFT_734114, partial [Amylocystis lapponica]